MIIQSAIINVMIEAIRKVSRDLLRDFGEVEHLQVSKKGPSGFVSVIGIRIERSLHEELKKARPDYGFVFKESGVIENVDRHNIWVINPLDGIINFLHGIPHFSISIGLMRDEDPIAGVIYQPLTDEMFWAERGGGAFVNGRRLRVSARRKMKESIISTGISSYQGQLKHQYFLRQLAVVLNETTGVCQFGSTSLDLAYVAAGRYDGFWKMNLKPWNIVAGIIIVKEAGGYITEISGKHSELRSENILAANDHIHSPLGILLRSID
ncbi:MAG: inositol monophosphatase [Rhodospirillaceae bacterium]|jgi:myo-inositol-1(or 4)-monophosphatase|nr:inositol monophosphatase [Rhodospirillaceae bacterium]